MSAERLLISGEGHGEEDKYVRYMPRDLRAASVVYFHMLGLSV